MSRNVYILRFITPGPQSSKKKETKQQQGVLREDEQAKLKTEKGEKVAELENQATTLTTEKDEKIADRKSTRKFKK